MSKIIKVDEYVDYSVRTEFSKDLGMFEVRANIWSCVSKCENGYDNDITETELVFVIDGKVCKYLGFKELYEKLFGENRFRGFIDDLTADFEEEYFKQSPYETK